MTTHVEHMYTAVVLPAAGVDEEAPPEVLPLFAIRAKRKRAGDFLRKKENEKLILLETVDPNEQVENLSVPVDLIDLLKLCISPLCLGFGGGA